MFELTKTRSKRTPRSAARKAIGVELLYPLWGCKPKPLPRTGLAQRGEIWYSSLYDTCRNKRIARTSDVQALLLVTHAGRFRVPHSDFIDIPPHDAEEPEPSFIVVYTKPGLRDLWSCRVSTTLKSNQSQGLERLLSELGFSTGLKTYRQKIEYFKKAM